MLKKTIPYAFFLFLGLLIFDQFKSDSTKRNKIVNTAEFDYLVSRICFGSCLKAHRPQPIWDAINSLKPEVFVFLGDNVYADTENPRQLRKSWEKLGQEPGFRKLQEQTIIQAIWDDHDYGKNDAGKEFSIKEESQQIFLDFFHEPNESQRRKTPGIYAEKLFGPPGQRVQLLLLDTRFFRDPLTRAVKRSKHKGPYQPSTDVNSTILGEDQWNWVNECLQKPADLRIVATSIQFISDKHGWETWGNFPNERSKLLNLFKENGSKNILLLSGDRHSAEFSKIENFLEYPLWDITSSPLNQSTNKREEENQFRVGSQIFEENFGMLEIKWMNSNPTVVASILDVSGNILFSQQIIGNH
tara:strand:- start:93 stop:1163 length:1071 start_codon:yes stop_codon:yes gene_type:complete